MKSAIKRARGGKVRDEEDKEERADDEADERARGGAVRRARGGKIPVARKSGGAISGGGDSASLAKRARGGRLALHRGSGVGGKFAKGGSPWSTARHASAPGGGASGHEGDDRPAEVP